VVLVAGIAACVGLFAGFLAGFGLVRRTQQWCPGCGAPVTPAHCPRPITAGQTILSTHRVATASTPGGAV
jgi:hypothetical protein